ncbi:MAG TPA: hypothetical protein VH479_02025 [Acidimicrobiales bacterium]
MDHIMRAPTGAGAMAADASGPAAGALAVIASAGDRVALGPGQQVTFGRGEAAHVRIGHRPVGDDLVPLVAGALLARDGRVFVANLGERLAFDIAVPGRAMLPLPPGDWHSPADPAFSVVVNGALRHVLAVVVHAGVRPAVGPQAGGCPVLTPRQRAILDAYVAPMADGRPAATHQQVAATVGCSRALVRLECTNIMSALLTAGVPMRDLRDARDAIADAWARHRM